MKIRRRTKACVSLYRQINFFVGPGVLDDRAFALEDAVLKLKTSVGTFAQNWATRSAAGLIGATLVTAGVASASAATFDCVMDPSLTVKLGSPVSSILSDVLVDRGDRVKKDQPVAQIESSVEEAAVTINKARASSNSEIEAKQAMLDAKAGIFKRKSDLLAKNVASTQDVETAQAEFNVATQDLALAKLNRQMAELELARSQALLDQRTIRSPLDGIVTQRALGPGEFVRPEANIVTIAKVDPLYVEAYLPVRYYGKIKVGDTAAVHPNQPIGGSYDAAVSIVDEVFDAASGTFGVRLNLPNPDYHLPGGLRCRVDFNVPEVAQSDVDSESSRR
jgi:RND family efflux transporter MFP subunit